MRGLVVTLSVLLLFVTGWFASAQDANDVEVKSYMNLNGNVYSQSRIDQYAKCLKVLEIEYVVASDDEARTDVTHEMHRYLDVGFGELATKARQNEWLLSSQAAYSGKSLDELLVVVRAQAGGCSDLLHELEAG